MGIMNTKASMGYARCEYASNTSVLMLSPALRSIQRTTMLQFLFRGFTISLTFIPLRCHIFSGSLHMKSFLASKILTKLFSEVSP